MNIPFLAQLPTYSHREWKPHILIVDNSKSIRRMIRLILKDLVGDIHECGDGCEALAAYPEHLPDWVLVDIRMKQTDGLGAR